MGHHHVIVGISQHCVTEMHTCCGVEHCHTYLKLWYSISLHVNGFILIHYTWFINFLLKKFKTKLFPTFLHKSFWKTKAQGDSLGWKVTTAQLFTIVNIPKWLYTRIHKFHYFINCQWLPAVLDPGHPGGSMLGCYSVYSHWCLLWFYGLIRPLGCSLLGNACSSLGLFCKLFFWLYCFLDKRSLLSSHILPTEPGLNAYP